MTKSGSKLFCNKIFRVRVGTKTHGLNPYLKIIFRLKWCIYLDQGKIRRIRGVAYSTRVSPQTPSRIVESARGILNQFLPDIFIFADVAKGQSCGKSPGFGCTLVAESTNENVRISAEIMSNIKGEKQISAEELGQQAALRLLEVCVVTHKSVHFLDSSLRFLGIECIWSLRFSIAAIVDFVERAKPSRRLQNIDGNVDAVFN